MNEQDEDELAGVKNLILSFMFRSGFISLKLKVMKNPQNDGRTENSDDDNEMFEAEVKVHARSFW